MHSEVCDCLGKLCCVHHTVANACQLITEYGAFTALELTMVKSLGGASMSTHLRVLLDGVTSEVLM